MFNPVKIQNVTLWKKAIMKPDYLVILFTVKQIFKHVPDMKDPQSPTAQHQDLNLLKKKTNALIPFPEACDSLLLPPVVKEINPEGHHFLIKYRS